MFPDFSHSSPFSEYSRELSTLFNRSVSLGRVCFHFQERRVRISLYPFGEERGAGFGLCDRDKTGSTWASRFSEPFWSCVCRLNKLLESDSFLRAIAQDMQYRSFSIRNISLLEELQLSDCLITLTHALYLFHCSCISGVGKEGFFFSTWVEFTEHSLVMHVRSKNKTLRHTFKIALPKTSTPETALFLVKRACKEHDIFTFKD